MMVQFDVLRLLSMLINVVSPSQRYFLVSVKAKMAGYSINIIATFEMELE